MRIKIIILSVILFMGISTPVSAHWAMGSQGPNAVLLSYGTFFSNGVDYHTYSDFTIVDEPADDDDPAFIKITAYNNDPYQKNYNVKFACTITENNKMYPVFKSILAFGKSNPNARLLIWSDGSTCLNILGK